MHVLVIPSERYVPKEKPLAGIFQYDQAHALKRAGVQVGVVAPMPRSLRLMKQGIRKWPKGIEIADDQGIPTYRYQGWNWAPGKAPLLFSRFFLSVGKRLFRRYVRDHGLPQVIHAHNSLYAGLLASRLKARYGVPFVLTEHSSAYLTGSIRGVQRPFVEETLRNASACGVVSKGLGRTLERLFPNVEFTWQWLPNVLDTLFEHQKWPNNDKVGSQEMFRFLSVGALIEIKNHKGLLRAFARSFKDNHNVQLRVGGDGLLREELVLLSRELRIEDQVVFLGALTREQVLAEMQSCDVFVLPSKHETFGVVIIEALSSGKPVVATACGGPEEIVNTKNGLLVPPQDELALAEALQRMFSQAGSYDGALIREECLSLFGEAAVVNRLKALYNRAMIGVEHDYQAEDNPEGTA